MNDHSNKIGIWIIGAGGAVSTTTILGTLGIVKRETPRTGMVSASSLFNDLPLFELEQVEFGGCDLYPVQLAAQARSLHESSGLFDGKWIEEIQPILEEISDRIQPGIHPGTPDHVSNYDEEWIHRDDGPAMHYVDYVRDRIRTFSEDHSIDQTVVVNLASTEPDMSVTFPDDSETFLKQLKEKPAEHDRTMPPSVLYATGSILEGCPFINFTPSHGSSIPPLRQLARERGVPHMGKDAKTGETLIKTVLAPMFRARNLKLLSWEGHNILGNEDGKTLEQKDTKKTKTRDKQEALSTMFPEEDLHAGVRIDYVPSLGDWKTAWDYIHFEGFLGTRMTMQFIWEGSDSMLAAPLVLDLTRFAELAERRGEAGEMTHLASFFKTPLGCEEHNFYDQFRRLLTYAEQIREEQEGD